MTDIPKNVLDRLAKKGFRPIGAVFSGRFVVTDGKGYRIARLSKGGGKHGGLSAKIGATVHTEPPHLGGPSAEPLTLIGEFLKKDRSLVTSHLYGTAFAVAKITPLHGWRYYKARITRGGVEVSPEAYKDRGAAIVQVQREGGTTPTLDLSSLPARPLNLYS